VTTPRLRPARATSALVIAALLVGGAAGCAPAAPPATPSQSQSARPLTTDEAQRLAMMRFRNIDAGARAVAFTVTEGDRELVFDGWFDYRVGVGFGALATSDADAVLQWTDDAVALRPAEGDSSGADERDQTLGPDWQVSGLDPASSRVHAMLGIVAALGADRPENPLLLQQTGALFLGDETVDGEELSVFAGPPSDEVRDADAPIDPDGSQVRYWLDELGLAHRVEVRLGGGSGWSRIDLGAADDVVLVDPFAAVAP